MLKDYVEYFFGKDFVEYVPVELKDEIENSNPKTPLFITHGHHLNPIY